MKYSKLILTLVLTWALAGLQSCMIAGEQGSGVVTSITRTVEPFTKIESRIGADIVLVRTESGQIRLEGEDNILPLIETAVNDGKLVIEAKKSFSSHKTIKIHIPFRELESISLLGSGNVTGEAPITGESFGIRIAGSADVNLAVYAKRLDTKISGSGNILLTGRVETHTAKISGSGKIKAFELLSLHTAAHISGSGTCFVSASDELDASVSGSGDILYKTPPAKLHKSVSGSGTVGQMN